MTTAIDIAAALLRQLEGLKLAAYPDPLSGGEPWTIGYGCTSKIDGSPVRKGDRLASVADADKLLLHVLGILQPKMSALVHVPLQDCEEAGLLSWQFNLGTGKITGSTLLRLLNNGDKAGAAAQFLAWDKGRVRGKLVTVSSLERRRKLEKAVFEGLVDPAGTTALPARVALAKAASSPAAAAVSAAVKSTTADLNDAELARIQTPDKTA